MAREGAGVTVARRRPARRRRPPGPGGKHRRVRATDRLRLHVAGRLHRPTPTGDGDHGTHVAGTIAAAAATTASAITGIAPLAHVLPLRAIDNCGGGKLGWIIEAFDDAGKPRDPDRHRVVRHRSRCSRPPARPRSTAASPTSATPTPTRCTSSPPATRATTTTSCRSTRATRCSPRGEPETCLRRHDATERRPGVLGQRRPDVGRPLRARHRDPLDGRHGHLDGYLRMGGTSMATPMVAGGLPRC